VLLHLSTVDGKGRSVEFGPLTPDRRQYPATITGCGTGCRLVGLELVAPRLVNTGRPATVDVYGLTGVPPATLTDMTRWRSPVGVVGIGTVLSVQEDRMSLTLYSGPRPPGQRIDPRVLANAAPTPLPIVLAGARPEQRRAGDDRVVVLGGARVPYQVVAEVPVLPRVGAAGALVDLEYAQRSNDAPGETAALEVWLTGDAPDSLVDALRERGILVLSQDTVDGRSAELARHGPGLALRFQVFAAGVLLLLAAGTIVVASTVERTGRAEELRALRVQGLPAPAVTLAGYAGSVSLAGLAGLTGVVAALLADGIVTAALPVFADGWNLLPAPDGLVLPLVVALAVSLVALGTAAYLGAERLVAAIKPTASAKPATEPASSTTTAIKPAAKPAAKPIASTEDDR
jgi:putative ABC transport system permease protein